MGIRVVPDQNSSEAKSLTTSRGQKNKAHGQYRVQDNIVFAPLPYRIHLSALHMVIVNGHPGVIERAVNNVDDMDEVENKAVDANGRIIGHQLLQHDLIRLRQDNLGKVVQN